MLKSYLISALRSLKKHRGYTVINISGLAVGMACCLLILLYVRYEMSYDRFHENASSIYRIEAGKGDDAFAGSPAPLGPILSKDFAEVVDHVRVGKGSWAEKVSVTAGEKVFFENRFFTADPSIFTVFTYPLVSGSIETALATPNDIVITESAARKYFSNDDPIGKTLAINKEHIFQVSAVAKDVPHNSHFHFDFLVSFENTSKLHKQNYENSWGAWNHYTYIQLAEGVTPESLKDALWAVEGKYRFTEPDNIEQMSITPLTGIHFQPNIYNLEPSLNSRNIYFLITVAFIVLLIACFNYMNLITAHSASRAREVGMRKVSGAHRSQLITQFIGESLTYSVLALAVAVVITYLSTPVFASLLNSPMQMSLSDSLILAGMAAITLFVGLISGSYPAFFISAYQPVNVLKGSLNQGSKGSGFRNSLVVFQFGISILLIIGTLFVIRQLNFIQSQDLGWDKDYVVTVPLFEDNVKERAQILKKELLRHPDIISASASNFIPSDSPNHHGMWWEGKLESDNIGMWIMYVDHDFMKHYKIKILAGNDFTEEMNSQEERVYIINESAAKTFGWDNTVGKQISGFGEDNPGTVVGVVKDFNFLSLHNQIEPCVFYLTKRNRNYFSIRVKSAGIPATMDFIKETWRGFTNYDEFEYFFVDEDIDKMYRSEIMIGKAIIYFTLISIGIACLGLFGLAAFVAERRRKEIGIRKVLGASTPGIAVQLSRDFTKWVLIANAIAWPLGYYVVDRWLQTFAFHIEIDIWTFILSGLAALAIALGTVSYQAVKSASLNPAEILKSE